MRRAALAVEADELLDDIARAADETAAAAVGGDKRVSIPRGIRNERDDELEDPARRRLGG